MKGSKGHQKSRKQRKQTGFKELAHICVLCSAIASPSLLSSSPIRVNPIIGYFCIILYDQWMILQTVNFSDLLCVVFGFRVRTSQKCIFFHC